VDAKGLPERVRTMLVPFAPDWLRLPSAIDTPLGGEPTETEELMPLAGDTAMVRVFVPLAGMVKANCDN
jgi:hypothetical protein